MAFFIKFISSFVDAIRPKFDTVLKLRFEIINIKINKLRIKKYRINLIRDDDIF